MPIVKRRFSKIFYDRDGLRLLILVTFFIYFRHIGIGARLSKWYLFLYSNREIVLKKLSVKFLILEKTVGLNREGIYIVLD